MADIRLEQQADGHWIAFIGEARIGSIRKNGSSDPLGMHVWMVDGVATPPGWIARGECFTLPHAEQSLKDYWRNWLKFTSLEITAP